MTVKKTGNSRFLKKYNEMLMLDLIRTHKAISRAELSRITGLSPTAAGSIVLSLMEKGYIHETGRGESKGGRRPVLFQLKPHSFYSVGVDIDVKYLSTVLIDITGKVADEEITYTEGSLALEDACDIVDKVIRNMLQRSSVRFERVLGIGISVPGMVEDETREIVLAPNLGWKNVNIRTRLMELFDIPIYVENESMASAICENWLGSCQGVDNFVCINVKSGIGAGIFTGGKLYRGSGGTAGEIGHIMVDENGPLCGCGNYGCLETMSSTSRIVEKARKLVRQGIVSTLNDFEDVSKINIDSIVEAAQMGDEAARNILMESARYLGIAISSIVNTLNPSKIIIGAEFVRYADIVMDYINNIVNAKALKLSAAKVEIVPSSIGEKSSALGAAIIPLRVFFMHKNL